MPDRSHPRPRRDRRPGYVFGPSAGGPDVQITPPTPGETPPAALPTPPGAGPGGDPLAAVRQGMAVSDAAGAAIGRVRSVHPGGVDGLPGAATGRAAPALPEAARARLPDETRERLLRSGFVLIDGAGVLAADRLALPEQIAGVSAGEVRLRVWRDQLLRAS